MADVVVEKWISYQNDLKLVSFVFPFFNRLWYCNTMGTEENANETSLKSFWPELHCKQQHRNEH